jgi:hypothetical protein
LKLLAISITEAWLVALPFPAPATFTIPDRFLYAFSKVGKKKQKSVDNLN